MQVTEILDKITERNTPVIGCIVRKGDRLHHNLDGYDLDCAHIADTVQDLLSIADLIEDGGSQIDTVFSEYDGQCLIGQRIDDSLLVTVSDHLQRGGFKKLQVGLSLQTRMLSKALDKAPADVAAAKPAAAAEPVDAAPSTEVHVKVDTESAQEAPSTGSAWDWMKRAVGAKAADSPSAPTEAEPVNTEGKKRRVYRGQVYWE